jgi:hypothetical protein
MLIGLFVRNRQVSRHSNSHCNSTPHGSARPEISNVHCAFLESIGGVQTLSRRNGRTAAASQVCMGRPGVGQRNGKRGAVHHSLETGFSSTPIFSISMEIESPARIQTGGVRPMPTP